MPKKLYLYGLPVLIILLLGFIHLPHPFHGDQAGYMVGAKELDQGGRLYIDYWDNKQPGIFFFYWLAGLLFGFSEVGVHSLELLIFCFLTILIVFSLRHYFHYPWMSSFVPITTIGVYYCITSVWHLSQLEIIVSLPLFLCAWLSSIIGENRYRQAIRWFMSGVSAGMAVVFKLVLAPIPIIMWLVVITIRLRFEGLRSRKRILWDVLSAFLGGLITLAMVAAWFASNDSLFELWQTTFVYPMQAFVDAPSAGLRRFIGSMYWFGKGMATLILLAFFVMVNWRSIELETVTLQMIGWLIIGVVVILIQRFSYWQYHFLLLILPIGVLSVRGIDAILSKYSVTNTLTGRKIKPIVLAICLVFFAFSPIIPIWGKKAGVFFREVLKGTSWRQAYQANLNKKYKRVLESTQFLKEDNSNKPIYVFGDPLYYFLTQKRQAIPEDGWAWEFYMPEQWASLISKLDHAKPIYIFISNDYADLIKIKLPGLYKFLDSYYSEYSHVDEGMWYRLNNTSSKLL